MGLGTGVLIVLSMIFGLAATTDLLFNTEANLRDRHAYAQTAALFYILAALLYLIGN